MRISKYLVARYLVDMGAVPVDFMADPDGQWNYDQLLEAAGFDKDAQVSVGALTQSFEGHPDGAAVVTRSMEGRAYIAVIECFERREPIRLHPEVQAPARHVQAA